MEFVGFLAALGGGIAIGTVYLGVDVKALAVGVLEKADIQVPAVLAEENRPQEASTAEAPQSTDANIDSDALSNSTALEEESIDASADHLSGLTEDQETLEEEEEAVTPLREYTWEEQKAATQACWEALNKCIRQEADKRNSTITDPQGWTLFDYLLHRTACHQQAVEELEALDQEGVTARLRVHLNQVLAWHRAGAMLYERATLLLTDAPAGKLSGPFAQSWQSAATQHRMEEKLILSKHASVGSYLEHAFKEPPPAGSE